MPRGASGSPAPAAADPAGRFELELESGLRERFWERVELRDAAGRDLGKLLLWEGWRQGLTQLDESSGTLRISQLPPGEYSVGVRGGEAAPAAVQIQTGGTQRLSLR